MTFREELEDLERRLANLRVVHVLTQPPPDWKGERGRMDQDLLHRLAPAEPSNWSALICGPPGMVTALSAAVRRLGLPQLAIQAEGFG